jgi:alpha-1,6-mannosyltransferase
MPVVAVAFRRLLAAVAIRFAHRQATRMLRTDPTPRGPLTALALSVTLLVVTAALGPSAAAQSWPGTPPIAGHLYPSAGLVTALLVIAVLVGAYGLLGCLNALKHAWAPDPKRLLAASALVVAVLAFLPPIGSADPGSYVGYGRLAATGHDPYATAPGTLTGSYGAAVEDPWRAAPSIYGPLATGEERLVATVAGSGAHGPAHAVFVLDLVNALAFVLAGLLLQRIVTTTPGRRRAALLFSANPLVLFVGVAGQHIDVLVAFLAVAAVAALARNRLPSVFVSGVLAGAAVAVKASAALVGVALGWPLRRRPRLSLFRAGAFTLGAAVVLVPGYLLAGHHAFDQLRHASGFVSFADPWRIVTHPLELLLGHGAARDVVRVLAWIAFAVMALLLKHGLPGKGRLPVAGRHGGPEAAARSALVLVLAWLLTAPYVLPWYAVVAWALLAALPASGYDRVLTIWTATLAIAYLPGRQLPLSRGLHDTLTVWKSGLAPVVLLGVAVAAAVLSFRRRA